EKDKRVAKCSLNLLWRAFDRRRVGNSPVGSHRLPRPQWANLIGCVIANREHEIDLRSTRFGELVPTLAAQPYRRNARDLQLGDCLRSHLSRRVTPGTVGHEIRR